MQRPKPIGYLIVAAVDRKQVLNQIVRAKAKEIDLTRESVGRDGRARNFDHRAHLRLVIEGLTFTLQLRFAFFQARERAAQFLQP